MTSSQKMEVCAKEIERLMWDMVSLEETICAHFSEELDGTRRWSRESARWSRALEDLHEAWLRMRSVDIALTNQYKAQ